MAALFMSINRSININKTKHKLWLDLFGTYSYSLTILPLDIFGVIKLQKKKTILTGNATAIRLS